MQNWPTCWSKLSSTSWPWSGLRQTSPWQHGPVVDHRGPERKISCVLPDPDLWHRGLVTLQNMQMFVVCHVFRSRVSKVQHFAQSISIVLFHFCQWLPVFIGCSLDVHEGHDCWSKFEIKLEVFRRLTPDLPTLGRMERRVAWWVASAFTPRQEGQKTSEPRTYSWTVRAMAINIHQ
jgi:hypothetical protein